MRVLIMSRSFVYPLGGFEEYIWHLIKKLSERGLTVELLTTTMLSNKHEYHTENINGVTVKRYPVTMKLFGYCYSRQLGKALKPTQYDILHAQGWGNYAVDSAWKDAQKKKKPFIITPHAFFHEAQRVRTLKRFYNKILARKLFASAHFIALTKAQAEQLQSMGAKNVQIIPEGITVKNFEKRRQQPSQYTFSDKRIILSVGRLVAYKGFDHLMEALKIIIEEVPEAHLVIVGQDWGYRDDLEKAARRLGVHDHVTFTGHLSREQLIDLYQIAEVYVNASRYEGFGITILEAMACGKPVISTKTGVALDLKDHILSYDYGNCKELAATLLEVLKGNVSDLRFGAKGVLKVRKEFDWNVIIDRIIDSYKVLIEQ